MFTLVRSTYEQFGAKCAQISEKDCRSLCNQSSGILKKVAEEVTCVHFRIARAVCAQADFSGERPRLVGGCFADNALEYYETLQLGKAYKLSEMVG